MPPTTLPSDIPSPAKESGNDHLPVNLTRKQKMNLTFATMRTKRTSWEARWADVAAHSDPYGFLLTPMMADRGYRKDENLLDTTPLKARKILKSGLFTSITPSASTWFKYRHPNKDIDKIESVKAWNQYVTDVIERIFEIGDFYDQAPDYFDKTGTYGTGAMLILDDYDHVADFTVFPTGSYWASCNAHGFTDTFIYQVRMSVREIVDEFCTDRFTGKVNLSKCSKALQNYWNSHMYEAPIDIIHFIGPRALYGPGKDGKGSTYKPGSKIAAEKKYGSWRYEWSLNAEMSTAQESAFGDEFLSESGFDDFRALVTPWDRTSKLDSYGTSSPGLDALPDERQLFFTVSQSLIAKEKILSPDLTGDSLKHQDDFDELPNVFVPEAPNAQGKGIRPIYQLAEQIIAAYDLSIEKLQEKVLECWDANTFQLLSNYENLKDVTAMAVTELKAEKMQKLGAVYGAFNDHFLKPLFKIMFNMAFERGLIPPPPPEMGPTMPEPELLGTMAQAMKLSNLAVYERVSEFMGKLSQEFPNAGIGNEINFSRLGRKYADTLSADLDMFNTDEEKAQIQQAQAKAAQAKQQQEAIPAMAGAAKDLAQAPTDTDNALTRLTQMNTAGK